MEVCVVSPSFLDSSLPPYLPPYLRLSSPPRMRLALEINLPPSLLFETGP